MTGRVVSAGPYEVDAYNESKRKLVAEMEWRERWGLVVCPYEQCTCTLKALLMLVVGGVSRVHQQHHQHQFPFQLNSNSFEVLAIRTPMRRKTSRPHPYSDVQ